VVHAHALGSLAALERNHEDAHDAVAGFCAAHRKLEEDGPSACRSAAGVIAESLLRSARSPKTMLEPESRPT
jgi:hypothetical protein